MPRRKILLICVVVAAAVGAGWAAARFFSPRPPALPPAPARPAPPAPRILEPILVDDFEVGATQGIFAERKNRLDAFQGTWARRPSYTVITKADDTRPGRGGSSCLRLEYAKLGGWCGWYTLLNGIDVSRHNALTFWVKGEQGGERFDIGFADEKMQELEIDAIFAGPIMAFLPDGVTTQWQQVKVPLAGLRTDMDMTRMGSLVLWFRYEGRGTVYVDDVAFTYDEGVERVQEENAPRAAANPRAPRFSWVWKYDPVNDLRVRRDLLDFARRAALETLFVYLGESPILEMPADYQAKLAQFLAQAHEAGVHVEALQGNPLWALKEYHPRVLEWVSGFLAFNRARPAQERIDGVSLDIEPYLTADWETGDRAKLQAEFVELMVDLRKLINSEQGAEGSFQMGLAIPVFYDREPEFEASLLKQVDYAALMDYYDSAVDIVKNARFHLETAKRLGKKVVIGVETQDLVQMSQGKRRNTFHEEGWEEMERQLAQVVEAFQGEPSFGGLAVHAYDSYRLLQKGRNVPTRERTGKVAPLTARPAPIPIAADGNLDEWEGARWYTFDHRGQVVYGAGAWKSPQDLSFKAAFQWSPEALYLAIEVADDALVQEWAAGDLWQGDHVELWLDVDLLGDYTEAVNSLDDFQLGLSPGNFSERPPEIWVWVPSVDPASLADVRIGAARAGNGYTLEVRLPSGFLFQTLGKRVGVDPRQVSPRPRPAPEISPAQEEVLSSKRFKPGFRLGVMIDGSDTDHAKFPQKALISTSGERQWGDPTTFNELTLE
ncbi:MAG: hypothetical protein HYS41_04520 [Candidatus Omnitrophica bacterium]|nr:hypothetical protein [Candidatus Omnitrophota bacterium]